MSNENISKDFESKIVIKAKIVRKQLVDLVEKIKEKNLDFFELPTISNPRKIAALDGGGYSQDFIGITVIPTRAAGAIFEQGKEPKWFEETDVEILTLEEDPKNYGALFRDLMEVKIAKKLTEQKPDILFLDGSITNFAYKGIPQSIRYNLQDGKEIEENSIGFKFYELFRLYIKSSYELLKSCIENNVLLVGVSKDSRANILVNELFGNTKNKPLISDTSLVNVIANGRTGFTKPIEFRPEIRDIRRKIWQAAEVFQEKELQSFNLSYIILKERAQPIRIDSLLPQQKRMKEIFEAMVTYHDGSGFITPAYLTHNHAHMSNDLGNRIVNYIAEEIFDESPEIFQSFFWPQRRDIIQ
ncbi:MAG: DNA double-strand break repair nuclease NurA [Candidatus Thorarchaeota archaeon]